MKENRVVVVDKLKPRDVHLGLNYKYNLTTLEKLQKRPPKIFIRFVFHHQHVEVKDVQVQWVLLRFY